MKKWLLSLIIIILIIAGGWYFSTRNRNESADQIGTAYQSTPAEPCADFPEVTKAITSLKQNNNLKDSDRSTESSQFPYKRSNTEPYVVYASTKSADYVFQPDSLDRVHQDFINQSIPELNKIDIERDPSQDGEQKNGFDVNNLERAFITGFSKGADRYVVVMDNVGSSEHDVINVEVECGRINAEWNKVYDDVIANSEYSSSIVIGPFTVTDGLYTISAHNGYAGGGGVTEYWILQNNKPRKIFTSQDYPPCKLLQENRVGKNLDCMNFDVGDNTVHKVTY